MWTAWAPQSPGDKHLCGPRDLGVTPALGPLVAESAITATQLWTLTCVRGTCPVIDEIAALDSADAWPDELSEQLADPTAPGWRTSR